MNIFINDEVLESIFLSCGTGEATQLVVFDSTLDQLDVLVKGVVPNTDIVLIKPQGNALEIISEALSSHAYQCLNIIAHGSPGCIQIGKHPIDSAQLHLHRDEIKQWSVEQINCYSCHLAQDPTFIAHLEQLTQASVAASEQPIGHKQQQGTWFISNSNGNAMKPPCTSLACDRFEGVLSNDDSVITFGNLAQLKDVKYRTDLQNWINEYAVTSDLKWMVAGHEYEYVPSSLSDFLNISALVEELSVTHFDHTSPE